MLREYRGVVLPGQSSGTQWRGALDEYQHEHASSLNNPELYFDSGNNRMRAWSPDADLLNEDMDAALVLGKMEVCLEK